MSGNLKVGIIAASVFAIPEPFVSLRADFFSALPDFFSGFPGLRAHLSLDHSFDVSNRTLFDNQTSIPIFATLS